jgi:hypothetical protein
VIGLRCKRAYLSTLYERTELAFPARFIPQNQSGKPAYRQFSPRQQRNLSTDWAGRNAGDLPAEQETAKCS